MNKTLRGVLTALFWLLVWQFASMAVHSALLLPSPLETLDSLLRLMRAAAFWRSTLYSVLRILAGYLLAVAAGILLGVITAGSEPMDALFRPIRSVMKATPVATFALLMVLWLPEQLVPVFAAFIMVLPLTWTNVQEGIRATDRDLLEMARLFRFGRLKTLRLVYFPSVLPGLLAACATGLGFAWKAGVAAEVIARTANSIGKNLVESKSYLEIPDMFAWTAVMVALSVLFERLLLVLFRRLNRRREGKSA
ncbi:MAG TPA: ABC transporter permease subunit [Feifaniaceae bacterium]|nr:ABC transporter permease subunit [Feifaniaceae bacterium]